MSAGAPCSICLASVDEDAKECFTVHFLVSAKSAAIRLTAFVVEAAANTVIDPLSEAMAVGRMSVRGQIIDTKANLRIKLGRGGLFWLEDIKGRAINAVAVLTPLLKGSARFDADR